MTMATTASGAPGDAVVIPAKPRGFHRCMRRLCKTVRPEAILYVPDASLNRLSLARCGLFRLAAGRLPIGMVTLQPNSFDFTVRLMLRLWRPDVVFAQAGGDPDLYRRYGMRYEVLPPAVDARRFRPAAGLEEKAALRRRYNLPEGCKVCLHVGHIRRSRNMDWLLQVNLPADAHLVVVGSASRALEQDLKRELEQRGATVIDSFLPAVEEVYRLADVYLFPVRSEKAAIEMPLSVLEAMACNLPVVTTPFGGLAQCFRDTPGLYYAETQEAFQEAVAGVLDGGPCATRPAVEPHTWQRLATTIWETVRSNACR